MTSNDLIVEKTSFLVTFEHTSDVDVREIEKGLEKMARSFGHHKPILSVDIQAAEQLYEP